MRKGGRRAIGHLITCNAKAAEPKQEDILEGFPGQPCTNLNRAPQKMTPYYIISAINFIILNR